MQTPHEGHIGKAPNASVSTIYPGLSPVIKYSSNRKDIWDQRVGTAAPQEHETLPTAPKSEGRKDPSLFSSSQHGDLRQAGSAHSGNYRKDLPEMTRHDPEGEGCKSLP